MPIFFYVLMNAPGKEKEKKKLLESTIHNLAECDVDDSYVDISVTCVRKDDEKKEILKGVPPVRIIFNGKH